MGDGTWALSTRRIPLVYWSINHSISHSSSWSHIPLFFFFFFFFGKGKSVIQAKKIPSLEYARKILIAKRRWCFLLHLACLGGTLITAGSPIEDKGIDIWFWCWSCMFFWEKKKGKREKGIVWFSVRVILSFLFFFWKIKAWGLEGVERGKGEIEKNNKREDYRS